MKTHYDVLQIQQTACVEVINAAYRALSKKYHPDICTLPNALELMQELNTAKDILTDSQKRSIYDLTIVSGYKPERKVYNQSPTEFDPNIHGDMKFYTRVVLGSEVNFKICIHGDYVYIHFYSPSEKSFLYVKDVVKDLAFGKWNPNTKFWKCHEQNTTDVFMRFGIW